MADKSKSPTCHEHKLCLTDGLDLKQRTRFEGELSLTGTADGLGCVCRQKSLITS